MAQYSLTCAYVFIFLYTARSISKPTSANTDNYLIQELNVDKPLSTSCMCSKTNKAR